MMAVPKTLNGTEIDEGQFLQWLKALRSGEYGQTQGSLNTHGPDGLYCCLGVLCDVTIPRERQHRDYVRSSLFGVRPNDQWAAPCWVHEINEDMKLRSGKALIVLNDEEGLTFEEIAEELERVYIRGDQAA